MDSEKEITTNKDIVKKVAERTGATEKQVEYILTFITKYIHSVMKDPLVLSIKLPYIGYMYLKVGFLKAFRYKDVYSTSKELYIKKARLFAIKRQNYITKIMITKCERRHAKKSVVSDYSYVGRKSVEEIENYQNTKWK
jgi:hypothetical protein